MKTVHASFLTGIFLLMIHASAFSQATNGNLKAAIIEPYALTITYNKTTNLIFPFAIKSVDRGSRDVLAQKAAGMENILLVKAGKENFPETNLSVITADGSLYSFLLNYSSNPSVVNFSFSKDTVSSLSTLALLPEKSEAEIQSDARKVAGEKRMLYGIKDSRDKMRFCLNGLYINRDVFYFQLEIQNRSHITYDIDMLRFFIRVEKRDKRTASQEIELNPLYVFGDTSGVKERSKSTVVVVLPKFTLAEKKYLHIELMEKAGGRHLSLKMHNRSIVKAKPVEP